MKKLLLILAVAVPLTLIIAGWSASAQDNAVPPDDETMAPEPDDAPMPFQGRMMEKFGITEEQVAKLHEARTAHMKEMIELGAKMKVAQIELRDLMKVQGNDDAVIAKHNEINDIRSKMSEIRLQHQLSMRAIFTAEQWEKVGKVFGMMQHRRSGGRGFGRSDGHRGMDHSKGMMGPRRSFGRSHGRLQPRV